MMQMYHISYTTPNHKCYLMFLYQYIDGAPILYQKKVQPRKLLNEKPSFKKTFHGLRL